MEVKDLLQPTDQIHFPISFENQHVCYASLPPRLLKWHLQYCLGISTLCCNHIASHLLFKASIQKQRLTDRGNENKDIWHALHRT